MNRYEITLLVPSKKEILAADLKEAGKEAKRLAKLHNQKVTAVTTIVRSVILIENSPEPIDFDFVDGSVA